MMQRGWPWVLYAALLAVSPWVFSSSLGLNLLSQMGIAIIVCLSYNILLGQGGMLSFGHAVYSGLGAFLAIHTLNAVSAGAWPLPVSLIPLVGGVTALAVALVLGWVSTQKAATPFAMITLGVGELVWAMSLMFPGFFGGEGGISGNRVTGSRPWGITFGPQIELYALIAIYTLVCTWLMYALTKTPLGRMLNAVRDNPERVAFIGYDPRMVRYLAFCIAAFFAGIGGGIYAHYMTAMIPTNFNFNYSAELLSEVIIGGTGSLTGSIIGAAFLSALPELMREFSTYRMLAYSVVLVLVMLFRPGGIFGRWEFSLTRALEKLTGRGTVKAKAEKGA